MEPIDALRTALEGYGFSGDQALAGFRELQEPLDLGANEFLVRAGEASRFAYFLAEGWIKYFHVDEEGREYIRYFCRGGHFVASYSALVGGRPSAYSIRTISPARLLRFPWEAWRNLAERNPSCGDLQARLLNDALIRSEERERSLILDGAGERYSALLEEFPGIEENVRQYDIAAFLGITPIALSRLRGRKATARRLT
jgi:CRP-like cAMP-binding protein